jgi:hypothetical protein
MANEEKGETHPAAEVPVGARPRKPGTADRKGKGEHA